MEDLYMAGMAGIGNKVAMQVIRRIVRDKTLNDGEKLEAIVTVVHSFENDTTTVIHTAVNGTKGDK